MPLYMDLHKLPHITIAEAKKAHVADEQIQRQYGVRYLQFWVNEEAGNLFCLVEGPDKATVESVHRMAHGHVACAVVEVDPSYYSIIMGNTNMRIEEGLVLRGSGHVDPGTRFILTVSFHEKSASNTSPFVLTRERMLDSIAMHNGRRVRVSGDDYLVNVFDHASEALQCAKDIQTEFQHGRKKSPVVFTIGLSAGQPVTENNEFIEETVRLARRLSLVADEGHIFVSSLFGDLCDDITKNGNKNVRSLTDAEEEFLTECFDVIDTHLTDENFSIDALVKSVGMSRTQLYRKVQSLTGKAPNTFIRDLRLERAKSLLKRKTGNISEIAYEVGFSNPSYFAKCFAKRFGYLPSESPQ